MLGLVDLADNSWVTKAFPSAQYDDAVVVASLLPAAWSRPASPFVVTVDGEDLVIPYRISGPELGADDLAALSATQRLSMDCLYTRHDDGRIRQRHLRSTTGETRPWIAPFVVQLVGEYVVDIIVDIRDGLADVDSPGTQMNAVYGRFAGANPEFIDLTRQRVTSYWDCYYRGLYPALADYPGSTVIESLRRAARQFKAG